MTEIKRRALMDKEAPNRSTAIVNGRSSNILNWDDVRFSWAYPKYKKCLVTSGHHLKLIWVQT